MTVRVCCPNCEEYSALPEAGAKPWVCSICGAGLTPLAHAAEAPEVGLEHCRYCGHGELYVQKDFPHWLGLSILLVAVVASFITYSYHEIAWTWVILLGSAAIDGLLYCLVGNVTICYRCLAQHRGFRPNPDHRPFDLGIGEKYRQQRLRRRTNVRSEDANPQ
jgi:hypothetical protein